ncbi:hypothetical protein Q8A67_013718 [Cirrhinus molitorella]|uniref:Uncharacterized protein n=1 Tax=Cirrhinus molitorella TaxID=172907 RepID=A0AA88PIV3_9TELE|nr:hypothetical protein Q8A67_013718 [Cirrhinus molitorella]
MVKSVKGRCCCKSREQIRGEEKRTGAIILGQAGLAGRMLGTKGREILSCREAPDDQWNAWMGPNDVPALPIFPFDQQWIFWSSSPFG